MEEYTKINTLFKRDMNNKGKIIENDWAIPEFEYLQDNQWIFTEKVDGTNIRISVKEDKLRFGGRTDNAQIPAILLDSLNKMFSVEKFKESFENTNNVTLYGEGFGGKIQSGGKYAKEPTFTLFDVKVENWWLQRESLEDIAWKLNIPIVPIMGMGSLHLAIRAVKEGLQSNWGNFTAEGLVLKPRIELKTRAGNRIIGKIKHKDFTGK